MILMTDGDDTSDVASEQRLASENDIIIYAIRIAANGCLSLCLFFFFRFSLMNCVSAAQTMFGTVFSVNLVSATDENELVNAVGDASRVFTAVNFVGLSNAIEAICKDIGNFLGIRVLIDTFTYEHLLRH